MEGQGFYGGRSPRYKSKGERRIGEYLASRKIAFQYEYPLAIVDRGQTRIWYPDFRLPEYGMIIEYFGMNGRPDYDKQMQHKIATYREAGIDGMYLVESSLDGDWQGWMLERIQGNLEGKLRKISEVSRDYSATPRTYSRSRG